jgi:hypothetical protein
MQTGCPYDLEIKLIIPEWGMTERYFHRAFSGSRYRGEWFYWAGDVANFYWQCDNRQFRTAKDISAYLGKLIDLRKGVPCPECGRDHNSELDCGYRE